MIKAFCIALVFVSLGFSCLPAEQYLIYHVSKPVIWLHNGKKETAKRGMYIKPQQSIVIENLNNIMLIQNDGKSLLIEKPGAYSFVQIKKLFTTAKASSVSSGFFSYVFDKFLHGDGDEEKQKVAAVVFRGPVEMKWPADRSFVFSTPVLGWKPKSITIPYKIELKVNGVLFDTVVRKQNSFTIPARLLKSKGKSAIRIEWICYAADSKQKPPFFLLLLPKKEDEQLLQTQIEELNKAYQQNPKLQKIVQKDLLLRWLELYGLK